MKCLNVLFPALLLAALLFAAGCDLAADEDAREKDVSEADTPKLERKVTPAESNADILIDFWYWDSYTVYRTKRAPKPGRNAFRNWLASHKDKRGLAVYISDKRLPPEGREADEKQMVEDLLAAGYKRVVGKLAVSTGRGDDSNGLPEIYDSWKPAPILLLRDLGMIIPWDRKNALWYLKDLTRPKDKDAGYWQATFAQRPDTYKEMESGDYDTVRLVVGPETGKTAEGKIEKAFPAYKHLGRRHGLHVFGAKQGKRKWADWEDALRKGLAEKDITKLPGSGRSWIVGRADCDEIHLDPVSEDVDDGPRHGFHLEGGIDDPATGQSMQIFMHYAAPGYERLDAYNRQRILAVGTSECLTVVVPLDFFLPKEKK